MQAIGLIFAAKFRQHWRSWLILSLLIALVSGFVMAAASAGRRTDSAFSRFTASHGYDAIVYSAVPLPQLAHGPEAAEVTPGTMPFSGDDRCTCSRPLDESSFAVRQLSTAGLQRTVKLVSGRMPDPSAADEALASANLTRDFGVPIGTVFRMRLYAPSQQQAAFSGLTGGPAPAAKGAVVTLRVVGTGIAENEFPSGQSPSYGLYPAAGVAAAHPRTPALSVYYVRLRHGQAGFASFEASISAMHSPGVQDLDRPAAAIRASIHPQAAGWWVLAALATLAGVAVLGQALARQAAADSADHPVLAALGADSRQLTAVGMLRTLFAGAAGAAGGAALALLLSPVAPLGEGRLADPSAGLVPDAPVLFLGAITSLGLTLALGLPSAWRSARAPSRVGLLPTSAPSATVKAVAAAGAPPTAVIGTRHALERGRGTRPVPVGTALAGTVAAVTALCATAVFGASLAHLTASPALYGAPFQAYFSSAGPGPGGQQGLLADMRHYRAIDRITLASVPAITVNGASVRAVATTAIKGPLLLSAAAGRLPTHDRDITLGASTVRRVGAHVGGTVRVTVTAPGGAVRVARYRVVGLAAFSGELGTGGLGSGAALTLTGYLRAACPAGPAQPACQRAAERGLGTAILVHATPGAAGDAALADLMSQHPGEGYRPQVPAALVNFGGSATFPLLLGAVLVLCGAAALIHLLVVSVSRRRRENGLLKALGFVRGQAAAVVFWQATTVAVIGIAAGVPLGLAAGRVIWRAFAGNLGVVAVPVLPGGLITLLAAGVLAAAAVIAIIPALAAARAHPAPALRAG